MHCPNCENELLQTTLTQQGVEVDGCARCHGVWLERGAINHFYKLPNQFEVNFSNAMPYARSGAKFSPRHHQTRLLQLYYEDQFEIEYCPTSNGLWFDSAELIAFNYNNKYFNLAPVWETESDGEKKSLSNRLLRLPNLYIQLFIALCSYFGVLWGSLYFLLTLAGTDTLTAIVVASSIIAVKILLAPLLLKALMRRVFHINWIKPDDLPGAVNIFIDKVTQRNNIRYPRIGIIETEIPNIFSFGYTHNHAHIILTKGLLGRLNDLELKAVVSHEIGKIVNRDMTFATQLQLLPFINRLLCAYFKKKQNFIYSSLALMHHYIDKLLSFFQMVFMRVRILHADRFSAINTSANVLSEALIKLNFQLLSNTVQDNNFSQDYYMRSVGTLGLLQSSQALALAVMSYHESSSREAGVEADRIKTALNWERNSLWSDWFEMWATYPAIYTRMQYLEDLACVNGMKPYLGLHGSPLTKNWDVFILQFIIYISPYLAALIVPIYALAFNLGEYQVSLLSVSGLMCIVMGLIFLLRLIFYYPESGFSSLAISALTKNINVSAIAPVACEVDGMLLGQRVPGYVRSDEIFIKDSTGIMIVEHHANFPMSNISSVLHDEKQFGKRVKITGWYRRVPLPYIEIKTIKLNDVSYSNVMPNVRRSISVTLVVFGVILFFL